MLARRLTQTASRRSKPEDRKQTTEDRSSQIRHRRSHKTTYDIRKNLEDLKMATEAQIKANRRNSQESKIPIHRESTGPRSPEGKAVVSKNAVKHGLFASENVIKGEKQADFDLFREETLGKLAPVGPVESMLAERFISLSWRLNRVGRMQNQAIDVMIDRDGPSPLTKQLDRLLMYERRIENSMIKMMDQLYKLRLIREMEEANAEVNQKSRCKMQNHNVKFKNSAFRPIRPESVENPSSPGGGLQNKANCTQIA
jgi:hypothetical protein